MKGEGGYVVAPPSRGYSFVCDVDPIAVPDACQWAAETPKAVGVDLVGHQDGDRQRLDVKAALERLQPGNRSHTFARVVGKPHRAGLAAEEILATLAPWAEKVAFPLTELQAEVSGITSRHPRPESSSVGRGGGALAHEEPETPRGGLREVSAASLLSDEGDIPKPEYRPLLGAEGFIVKGWSHILASCPKVGKTELATDTAVAWADAGLRVLYFTEEPESV